MQEMRVWSLCQEDPLEKEIVTHSNIRAWEIPWTEEPGWIQSIGSQRVGHEQLSDQITATMSLVITYDSSVMFLLHIFWIMFLFWMFSRILYWNVYVACITNDSTLPLLSIINLINLTFYNSGTFSFACSSEGFTTYSSK